MKKTVLLLFFFTGIINAQIVTIPDPNFKAKLIADGVDTNSDGNIQISEAAVVGILNLGSSNISDLTGIDSFTSLVWLWCDSNNLTSLNVSSLQSLKRVYCHDNNLTSLNVAGLTNLEYLYCSNNNLTTLDLSGLPKMFELMCDQNHLTTVDTSSMHILQYLDVKDNPELVYLNIKNGSNEVYVQTSFLGSLDSICVDDFQIASIQNCCGGSYLEINSYCSFVPGGDYNTISGRITFDSNNNGCDLSDSSSPSVKVNSTNGYTFTDTNGNYSIFTQTGDYVLTPLVENPSLFTFSPPSATITFSNNQNNVTTQNFCLSANGIHPDVEIVIIPLMPARPGFDAVYKLLFVNKGNQTLSGTINFSFDDSVLDFVSASQLPNVQNSGNLSWNYSGLLPFETRDVVVTINVNSPIESPAVNIGDFLNFTITISSVSGDEYPADNEFTYHPVVVGSLDPNDKACLEGDIVSTSKIGDYLHYNINFENTGTAPAENIVVKDIIDSTLFDITSLQIMDSSHPMITRITGNKVEFIFENIDLAASAHGNVAFKLKTKTTLVTGNTVTNKADIYFDFNAPVTTNTAATTFQTLGLSENEADHTVKVYPNPTKNSIIVDSSFIIKSIQLLDVNGRVLATKRENESHVVLDVTKYAVGVYFLKITSEKGISNQKLVKQ